MVGIEGFWVWLAYLCCIISTILCVVYGAMTWGRQDQAENVEEEAAWIKGGNEEVDKSMP